MSAPVPGAWISCEYGVPGSWAAGYHTGRDWAAPQGTPVLATRGGTVIEMGYAGDYGNQVIIDHGNGIRSLYNHLVRFSRSLGPINAGEQVGEVGSTGNSTGPHCHYEERTQPYGYHDHRRPEYDQGGTAPGSGTPSTPSSTEEDDMFIAEAPARGAALMAPGYFKGLTEEERDVLMDFGVRLVKHNERGFDVCRAVMLQGQDSVTTD